MLIGFAGLKGSGKDTAAKVLIEEYGFTKIAFADAVRDLALIIDPQVQVPMNLGRKLSDPFIANSYVVERLTDLVAAFGWDFLKREVPEVRRLLQVIGTEGGRNFFHEAIWIEIINKQFPNISWDSAKYVVTDCRFDNEVAFVRDKGGELIWVDRPGLVSDGHASESEHIKDLASVILHNTESVEELQEDVRLIMFMRGIEPIERGITN